MPETKLKRGPTRAGLIEAIAEAHARSAAASSDREYLMWAAEETALRVKLAQLGLVTASEEAIIAELSRQQMARTPIRHKSVIEEQPSLPGL